MVEEPTRYLSEDSPTQEFGSWSNPEIAARNRQQVVYAPVPANYASANYDRLPESYRAPLGKVPFAKTRTFFLLCLTPLLLALMLSTSLAGWSQQSLIEDQGFDLVTAQMAQDQSLQNDLKQAVVSDIMQNSAITSFIGNGKSTGFLSGVKNWAHDQVQNTVISQVNNVFSSADYPKIWQQVMDASHTYNMNNPDMAGIDIAPIFNAVDAKIGTIFGFDPDLTKTTFIVPLESQDNKVLSNNIAILKNFGASYQAQFAASLILAAFMFLLAPTRRFWWAAVIAGLGGLLLWVVSTLVGNISLPSFGSQTAQVFINGLTDAFSASLSKYLVGVSGQLLLIAGVAAVLGILVIILKLFAKGSSARTRRFLKALG